MLIVCTFCWILGKHLPNVVFCPMDAGYFNNLFDGLIRGWLVKLWCICENIGVSIGVLVKILVQVLVSDLFVYWGCEIQKYFQVWLY